jgi:putative ABC transport system permease protein
MSFVIADLRHGFRLVGRAPGFSIVAIATLALGIGANTAIFSTINDVLFRPLPYGDPERIVMVWEDVSYLGFPRNTPAPANYLDWKGRNRVFTDMAATFGATASLTSGGPPEQVMGRRVTANFFGVLDVKPLAGRTFSEEEDRTGAPVTVISYGLWQRRFGGNPSAVGSDVTMNGAARTVIGVMPADFSFRSESGSPVEFWWPAQFTPAQAANRTGHYLNVVARLRPNVTIEHAREEMDAIAAQLRREFPDTNRQVGAVVTPIRHDLLGNTRFALLVLTGAAGCVLLIACANLASLMLSRAVARRSEMAVRVALGAGTGRLVRQMVAEAMVLAAAGGLLGLIVAPAAMNMLAGLVPPIFPLTPAARLNPALLLFTAALSIVTGLIFSIVPAVHAARASLNDALQQGGRSGAGGSTVTRDVLVVAQVAAALVLLVGAGLMIRTLANLRAADLGFQPAGVLTMRTTLPQTKYPDETARLAFYDAVLRRVSALPGVERAAYASILPFMSQGNTTGFAIENKTVEQGQDAVFRTGTPQHLQLLGVQLLEGRILDERDGPGAPLATVINETFARTYWPGSSPLGARIRFGGPTAPWRTVVGVVKDVRERGFDRTAKPGAYVIYSQLGNAWIPDVLAVRASGHLTALIAPIREIVADVDREQPIAAIRTMEEIVDQAVVGRRQQMTLLTAFAGLALLLASIGLYGVLSYAVTRRQREIGVRLALGATRTAVVGMIIRHGLLLTGAGLAAGFAFAWLVTRTMSTMLYNVAATDLVTFVGVFAVLVTVAAAACALPALRASRLDPMKVLRDV